jgi:hypothetical protein
MIFTDREIDEEGQHHASADLHSQARQAISRLPECIGVVLKPSVDLAKGGQCLLAAAFPCRPPLGPAKGFYNDSGSMHLVARSAVVLLRHG